MKHTTVILTLCLLANVASTAPIRLSDPVQSTDSSETFGAPLNELPAATTISELKNSAQNFANEQFSMEAQVSKVCQKKGCFFIAQQGEELIRVSFKDYGFFVPTDIAGQKVTLVGELVSRDISPKQAKHFAKDLGEKGSVASGVTYEIIASSVRVPIK